MPPRQFFLEPWGAYRIAVDDGGRYVRRFRAIWDPERMVFTRRTRRTSVWTLDQVLAVGTDNDRCWTPIDRVYLASARRRVDGPPPGEASPPWIHPYRRLGLAKTRRAH